ncbi:FtsX-like permease family protein [Leucobacter massiliensis]|uniref:Permease n=1 Tax=Leucobacter massiliensis TaxID=1686285 RepID=A0A2S9QRU1_9MICO|nr:FtsX-like permease family protein [Leucobacter massiliensis]PRI12298.1 permease [Leucobacter massiliensis]
MIARVLWLLSRPAAQGRTALLLPVIAYAAVTALLGIVLGGAQRFWGYTDELGDLYRVLAAIALALLVVPLVTLAGAAARLSVRRRDERLSTLRLLGATGRQVSAMTVIESAAVALCGALLGLALAYAASPLIGLIHFRGEALGTSGAALHAGVAAALVAGVTSLAAVSAVVSLRRVVISPLGVALKHGAPRLSWLRALIAVLVIAAALGLLTSINPALLGAVGPALFFGGLFAAVLAVLGLVGPWLIGVLARGRARRAQTPRALLSARMILEDPRAAWRQVSGVAMASFMAVFAGSGMALLGAMDASAPAADADPAVLHLPADIRTGILITVVGAFLTVAASVGVGQAAALLDRRDVIRSLDMLGAPLAAQDEARRSAVMLPLLLAALGSAGVAAALVLPLLGIALIVAPVSLAVVFSSLAAGILLVRLGIATTRPLLARLASAAPAAV